MPKSIETQAREYRKEETIGRILGSMCLGVGIGAIAYGSAQHDRGLDALGGGLFMSGAYFSMWSGSAGRSATSLEAEIVARQRPMVSPSDIPPGTS